MSEQRPSIEHDLARVALFVAYGVLLQRLVSADQHYVVWSDRDLWRTARVLVDHPTAGAEMNYGGGTRLPGGLYHWLLAPVLALREQPADVTRLFVLLDAGALGVIARLAWVRLGAIPAAAVALIYLSDPLARRPMAWLWNPAMLPLVVVGLCWLLIRWLERGGHRWPLAFGALASVGMSAHMTALTWAAWLVLGAAAQRGRAVLAGLPMLFAGLVLPLLPFLAVEGMTGGRRIGQLLQQGPLRAEGGRFGFDPSTWLEATTMLAAQRPEGWTALHWLGPALALVGLLSLVRHETPVWLRAVGVAVLMTVSLPAIDAQVNLEWRYLLAAWPGVALLGGVGVALVLSRLRGLVGTVVGGLCLALLAISPLADSRHRLQPSSPHPLLTWEGMEELERVAAPWTGGELPGLVGRLAGVRQVDGRWEPMEPSPRAFALAQGGMPFPGSLPPPCLALVTAPSQGLPDLAALAGRAPGEAQILETIELPDDHRLLVYDLAGGLCPTTSTNRYVPTPTERRLRPLWDELVPGDVRRLDDLLVTRLSATGPEGRTGELMLALQLQQDTLTLHGPQLRGKAYNAGWLTNATFAAPRLVLRRGGETREWLLYDGILGTTGIVPPLSWHVPEGLRGRWQAELHGELFVVPREVVDFAADGLRVPVVVQLGEIALGSP